MPHAVTIAHVSAGVIVFALLASEGVTAQQRGAAPAADPFADRGWHLELASHYAPEAWNYNVSREQMFGIAPGLTYGLTDGLAFTIAGPLYFVDQRGIDAWVLAVNFGLRSRVVRRGRVSAFVEFQVGLSEADTRTPPGGTRFNYLALGGAGATMRIAPAVHLVGTLRWIHVSNGGREGRSRNPDIEAVGPQFGVLIGF